jgi:hypothetical protein
MALYGTRTPKSPDDLGKVRAGERWLPSRDPIRLTISADERCPPDVDAST